MPTAIAVMAKAPRPGRCKTRLVPPLSPAEAAHLSAAFLRDISENLFRAGDGIVPHMAYAPAGAEAELAAVAAPGTRLLLADGAIAAPPGVSGFGLCLLQAVRLLLAAGHDAAGLLNSDSPTLPTDYLRQAARWLAEDPGCVVLGPADDGGYYFIGMTQPHAALFADIAWSTGAVAEETRARAREAGIALRELPPWYDVDDAASLARLAADLAAPARPGFPAPATAAWLAARGAPVPLRRRA